MRTDLLLALARKCEDVVPVWTKTGLYGLTEAEWKDYQLLAANVQRYLADEDKPIQVNWLLEVGFKGFRGEYSVLTGATSDSSAHPVYLTILMADKNTVFAVSLAAHETDGTPVGTDVILPPVETRGDLLRLCAVLKAELKS